MMADDRIEVPSNAVLVVRGKNPNSSCVYGSTFRGPGTVMLLDGAEMSFGLNDLRLLPGTQTRYYVGRTSSIHYHTNESFKVRLSGPGRIICDDI